MKSPVKDNCEATVYSLCIERHNSPRYNELVINAYFKKI